MPPPRSRPPRQASVQPRTTTRTEARTAPPAPLSRPQFSVAEASPAPRAVPRGIGVEQVVAEGWGDSEEQALRDALRTAIRQVIGTIVSTRTEVDNDTLSLDRIITYSGGFIDHYENLETTYEGGHVHRRINATVRRRDLARHLHSETAARQDGRGLWPELVTKIDRWESATSLLRSVLEVYPWNCLDLSLEGRPAVLDYRDREARLGPRLVFRIDSNRFRETAMKLNAALEGLATIAGTVTTRVQPATGPSLTQLEHIFRADFFGGSSPSPLQAMSISAEAIQLFGQPQEGWPPKKLLTLTDKSGVLFVVGNGRRWNWYLVQESLTLPSCSKIAWVDFRDDAKRSLSRTGVGMGPRAPGMSIHETAVDGKKLTTVFVSPFFLDHAADGYVVTRLAGCTRITVSGELRVPVAAIAEVTHIEARLDE